MTSTHAMTPDGSGTMICVAWIDHTLSADTNSWNVQKLNGSDASTIVAL